MGCRGICQPLRSALHIISLRLPNSSSELHSDCPECWNALRARTKWPPGVSCLSHFAGKKSDLFCLRHPIALCASSYRARAIIYSIIIWHVRLGVVNNMRPPSWGGHKRKRSKKSKGSDKNWSREIYLKNDNTTNIKASNFVGVPLNIFLL